VSIALFEDSVPQLGAGTSPSTHILKPDIRRFDGIWSSALNETLIMQAASTCGLVAAPVFYEPTTRACVVERFDRFIRPDGTVGRVLQYDMCQLSSLPSGKKYEVEGGPSLKDCADLVRKYSAVPAVDLTRLISWVFFNIFTGNNDSHAKNLSIYSPQNGGTRLTPFYDLMCTRIYPGLAQNFAFNIGGTAIPGEMEKHHLVAMAGQLNLRPKFVLGIGQKLANQLAQAMGAAAENLRPVLQPKEITMTQRLLNYVGRTTRQAAKRMQLEG
jgi:serine/threonine-protein kinase HipA